MRSFLSLAALLVTLLVLPGCHDDFRPFTTRFLPNATSATPNLVRLVDGGQIEDTVTVHVAIGGPTTSSDIKTVDFRIQIGDTSIVEFIEDSEVVGPALLESGCPDPIVLVSTDDRDVAVSIAKLNPCAGNGIADPEQTLISLTFRLRKFGATAIRLGTAADPPVAIDSRFPPQVIDSVRFDLTPVTLVGF